ncbi:MAG: MFS transporter [Ruminococcaceae bacterium]|nr:MFS transporter [Oscillospiraceae bacterium]MBR3596171.1 hypothetical protein [Clostridia bacterium]
MQLHKEVENFLKECYPKGLPFYRKKELKKELLSHIYEKSDYYLSQGKSDTESIVEAVKDMGDPSKIRQSFGKIYRFERLPAIISFITLSAICVLAFFTGFILFSADTTSDYPTVYHYFISASFVGSIVFMYIYGFRKKKAYLLLSVTVYMFLNLLTCIFTSGIFQSVSIGIVVIFCALLNIPEHITDTEHIFSDAESIINFGFYLTIAIMLILFFSGLFSTIIVFTESKRKKRLKKMRTKKPLIMYFSLIFSLVILSSVLFYFTAQEYSFMDNNIMTGSVIRIIHSKKGREAYEELKTGMSETDAGIVLRGYDFREYKKSDGINYFPDLEPGYSMHDSKVYIIEDTSYTHNSLFNDIVIILKFNDNKLSFKQVYIYNNRTLGLGIWRNEDTSKCYENYLTLKEGDSREDVLKKFPSSVAFLETAYFDYESDTEVLNYRSEYEDRSDYSINADAYTSFCFVDGKLVYSEITGFGEDKVYNYDELGLNRKR